MVEGGRKVEMGRFVGEREVVEGGRWKKSGGARKYRVRAGKKKSGWKI